MTKIQLSWLHLPITFPSWNTLEVHSFEYHKRYSLRQFGMASRSSINSTMLEDYERNPKPLQATILISGCNNLQTAFSIYNTLIKHGSPTLGVFKSLIETCLELGQPKRAIDVWKDMEKHSIILDYYCFGLLTRICAKTGDSILVKKLFEKLKNKEFKFGIKSINCAQMIQALSYGGKMEDSMKLLDWMTEHDIQPEGAVYVCLLKPCRDLAIGRRIHAHIIKTKYKLDIILVNSLLNMYSKCGSIDDARSIFDNIESKDIISWNAMISGYEQNGNAKRIN
jgi:pentatricopeptide repeat protein